MKTLYQYIVSFELEEDEAPQDEIAKSLEEHVLEFVTELNGTECLIRTY